MYNLRKVGPALYELPREGDMRVPGLVVITEELMGEIDFERPLSQVRNVAHLPGIVGHSIAMPDIHWGYGFPIGGVAATDLETGVISPGGVGYDINCGVRLAVVPEPFHTLGPKKRKKLIDEIFRRVPSGVGVGHKGKHALTDADYQNIAEKGARWAIENGHGFAADLDATESYGVLPGAEYTTTSEHARERGRDQLGTVGSGNHFVEIGEVADLLSPQIAEAWGIEKGETYVLIHSGSRGFGHQVCQDTLDLFLQRGFAEGLPDRQLVAAPIPSSEGQQYLQAMATAANYAFCNRQMILHAVREAFHEVLRVSPERVRLIYDVCHNIAKVEEHLGRRLCVHRKGATRALGAGHEELASQYRDTGQPVLVPGDMRRASYLMVGLGNPQTFCSSCHGAGRARSRIKSAKAWRGVDLFEQMAGEGVIVRASSSRTVAEEMPDAYKDVDVVVEAVEEAGLAKRVARLKPHMVIKG